MNVVWTKAALKQLRSIHDYIAADSIGYAKRLTDRLIKRSEQLANSPESGGRVLEYDNATIRELLEGPYRIIYRIRPSRVDVIAVIHGARPLPSDLRQDQ